MNYEVSKLNKSIRSPKLYRALKRWCRKHNKREDYWKWENINGGALCENCEWRWRKRFWCALWKLTEAWRTLVWKGESGSLIKQLREVNVFSKLEGGVSVFQ